MILGVQGLSVTILFQVKIHHLSATSTGLAQFYKHFILKN